MEAGRESGLCAFGGTIYKISNREYIDDPASSDANS